MKEEGSLNSVDFLKIYSYSFINLGEGESSNPLSIKYI